MAITSVALDDSTPAQRRRFATEFLSLDLPAESSDDQVLALIQRAQPGVATIFVMEAPAVAVVDAVPDATLPVHSGLRPEEQGSPTAGSLGAGDPRFKIIIPVLDTDDTADAAQDVLVGINGRAWQLRRGAELNVPARVVEALNSTIARFYKHDDQGNETARDAKRIPFEVLERPSAEAMAEWHARTDAQFNP